MLPRLKNRLELFVHIYQLYLLNVAMLNVKNPFIYCIKHIGLGVVTC